MGYYNDLILKVLVKGIEKTAEEEASDIDIVGRAYRTTIEGFESLYGVGETNIYRLGEKLDLSPTTIELLTEKLNQNGQKFSLDRKLFASRLNTTPIQDYYRRAVEEGRTIEEIAQKTGIQPESVRCRLSAYNLLTEYRKRHPSRGVKFLEYYKVAIAQRKTINKMAEENRVQSRSIIAYLRRHGLLKEYKKQQERLHRKRNYEGLQEMIEEGLTLREIGEHFGVSKQRILEIKERDGISGETRENRRQKREQRQHELQRLAGALYQTMWEKAAGDKAIEKALEYYYSRDRVGRGIPLNRLVKLFQRYYHAKESGEKLALWELGEEIASGAAEVRKILIAVGEHALYRTHKNMRRLTKKEKLLVKRTVKAKTDLSYADMSKLLNIPPNVLSDTARKLGKTKKIMHLSQFGFGANNDIITYSKAMDFLDAWNARFSIDESMEYSGIRTGEGVKFVLLNRYKIRREVNKFKREVGLIE